MANEHQPATEKAHEEMLRQGLTPRDESRTEYVDHNGTLRALVDGGHTKSGNVWEDQE